MSEFISIGNKVTMPSIRDYIITHRINQGDTIVVSQTDHRELIQEAKDTSETLPDFPMKIMGVIIAPDTTDSVPVGKVQIIKNEEMLG
jgi:hypothetical protein